MAGCAWHREHMTDAREVDGPDADMGDDDAESFGDETPTRFGADVEYRGHAAGHDYVVRVRHRFLDTSFALVIDGVEHDPKAEEEQRKRGGEHAREPGDGLRFRLEENFTVLYCTVRRPDEDGDPEDAEVIEVRTAGLGGAGEVDVRRGIGRTPLAPGDDSPSAVRDRKRTAHPTRYALVAAVAKAATFLIPLLGIGALLSGLLRPVRDWVRSVVEPVIGVISRLIEPVRQWISELLRPVREFFAALFRPVREFIADLLQPVFEFLGWLRDLLLGWIPDLSLPFEVPGWVVDIAIPVIIVLVVFAATLRRLRRRRERLEASRASGAAQELQGGVNGSGAVDCDGSADGDEAADRGVFADEDAPAARDETDRDVVADGDAPAARDEADATDHRPERPESAEDHSSPS